MNDEYTSAQDSTANNKYAMPSSYQPTVGQKTAIVVLSGFLILARSDWR